MTMRSFRSRALALTPGRPLAALLAFTLAGASAGCSMLQSNDSNLLGIITPYRIEVVQGNVLTKEQVATVQPGQTRAQVRDNLGAPLLTDTFHVDRWDYVFTIRRQGAQPQQRRVVARFDGDVLKSLEGAESLPSERDFVDSIDTTKVKNKNRPLELTEAEIKALPVPPKVAEAASAPEGPVRTYPPLERS